jgi:hypothetical protein
MMYIYTYIYAQITPDGLPGHRMLRVLTCRVQGITGDSAVSAMDGSSPSLRIAADHLARHAAMQDT